MRELYNYKSIGLLGIIYMLKLHQLKRRPIINFNDQIAFGK